jgi:hypothetical protein
LFALEELEELEEDELEELDEPELFFFFLGFEVEPLLLLELELPELDVLPDVLGGVTAGGGVVEDEDEVEAVEPVEPEGLPPTITPGGAEVVEPGRAVPVLVVPVLVVPRVVVLGLDVLELVG